MSEGIDDSAELLQAKCLVAFAAFAARHSRRLKVAEVGPAGASRFGREAKGS